MKQRQKSGKKEIVHRHGVTKAEQGHFAKSRCYRKEIRKEFKFENTASDYALLYRRSKLDIF